MMKDPEKLQKRSSPLHWGALFAIAFYVTGAAWFEYSPSPPPLEKIRPVPEFNLTESSGRGIGLSDLKGKVWLADLIYTTCPSICPVLSGRLSALQSEAFKNGGVRFVSISVNPAGDTPEVLRTYAEKYHATPGKWYFLTGDKTAVSELANRGFMLAAGEPRDDGTELVHSTKIALVDKNGVIRAYYEGVTGDESRKILRDIRALLGEPAQTR